MSHKDEREEINHVQKLIEEIDSMHGEIEGQAGGLTDEQKAIKEDLERFQNGEISEERMIRILQEFQEEEEEQEQLIQYEGKSIKETREALKELRETMNEIKKNQEREMKNFQKASKGLENALGSVANADSFKGGVKGAVNQMWNSVESMDADTDEEAEMSEELDILGHEIGKAVKEDEELLKDEKEDYELEEYFENALESLGAEEGAKKNQELAEKDKEEFEETKQEFSQIEELTAEEEDEIKTLYNEISQTVEEAKEMSEEIEELIEEIEEAPGDNRERVRQLNKMEAEIESNIKEAQQAMEKLEEALNYAETVESEESSVESMLG